MTFYLLHRPQRCLKTGVSTSIAQKAKNENTKIKPVLRILSPEILNLSRIKKNEISMHILQTCRIWPLLWTSHKKWRGRPAGLGFDTGLKRTAVLRRQSSVSAGATFNHSWQWAMPGVLSRKCAGHYTVICFGAAVAVAVNDVVRPSMKRFRKGRF